MFVLYQWFPNWVPARPGGVSYAMGDWEALKVFGGVAIFDVGLAVAYLGFLEKVCFPCYLSEEQKKGSRLVLHVKLSDLLNFSMYLILFHFRNSNW